MIAGSTEFIIDSGATSHIVNNSCLFVNYYTARTINYLRTASGNTLPILGKGTIGPLLDVLFVPGATRCLISVSKLTRRGHTILFKNDFVYIDDVIFGHLTNNLYTTLLFPSSSRTTIPEQESYNTEFLNDTTLEDTKAIKLPRDISLLHRRFGHADVGMLKKMIRCEAVEGLELTARQTDPHLFHCDACRMAKATKLKRHKWKSKAPPMANRRGRELFFDASDIESQDFELFSHCLQ